MGRRPAIVEQDPLVEPEEAVDVSGDLRDVRIQPYQRFGETLRVQQVGYLLKNGFMRGGSVETGR